MNILTQSKRPVQSVWWLEHCGDNDYRLFDAPPTEPQGFSYDFTSLYRALIFAKTNNMRVEV